MLKERIEQKEIRKIFNNKEEKLEYLKQLYKEKGITSPMPKTISAIDKEIINTWEFNTSNKIIREMFKKSEKYRVGASSAKIIKKMMDEWNKLGLGDLEWPFRPISFDWYIQRINTNKQLSEREKDEKVMRDIIKFRRIKEINTARNDFIEYLIADNNANVTPTLKHNQGIDFYINGYPYDQKVSRSVTNDFKNDFGDNWKEHAKKHPEVVAEYLYKYQDEARFGAESRLLIVYLDDDITEDEIYNCVINTNFKEPKHIHFEYEFANHIKQAFDVDCYIVLLSK